MNYAVEAFSVSATDFLLKPITFGRFVKAISKLEIKESKKLHESDVASTDCIFVKKHNSYQRIKYAEILYIEALENYVTFITTNDKIIHHKSLRFIEQKLPSNMFKKVHRSFIINMEYIKEIYDDFIYLQHGSAKHKIPIGKLHKHDIIQMIKQF
jgi:DNA-binding LytR/AlgR family response regulator